MGKRQSFPGTWGPNTAGADPGSGCIDWLTGENCGGATKFANFGSVVQDIYQEHGPLGGIQAALATTSTELNLILAVEPAISPPEFLRYLISRAENPLRQ